jgi:hypothetical protein
MKINPNHVNILSGLFPCDFPEFLFVDDNGSYCIRLTDVHDDEYLYLAAVDEGQPRLIPDHGAVSNVTNRMENPVAINSTGIQSAASVDAKYSGQSLWITIHDMKIYPTYGDALVALNALAICG